MLEPLVTLGVRCTTSEESGVQSVLLAFVGDWWLVYIVQGVSLLRLFWVRHQCHFMLCFSELAEYYSTVHRLYHILTLNRQVWAAKWEGWKRGCKGSIDELPNQTSKLCFQMQDSKTSCHVLSTGLGPESWLRLSHSMKVLFTTTWQMNSSCKAHMALQASDSMVRDGPWWCVQRAWKKCVLTTCCDLLWPTPQWMKFSPWDQN